MFAADLSLARQLEAAHASRTVRYARAKAARQPGSGSQATPIAGGWATYAGPISPINRAIGLGLDGPVQGEQLDTVEHFFYSHGEPPRIDLCPLAHASLRFLLKQRGYRLEKFYNVLYRPILRGEAYPDTPAGMQVRPVPRDEADLWLRAVAEGFTGPQETEREVADIIAPTFFSEATNCYLAWINGEPAGGGAMVRYEAAVELCSASTRPAFRRQGVQTALIYARLAAAQDAGCSLALSLTSPGSASQRNVERAGFRLAYTRVVMIQD